jgi:four helix bundle protein
MGTISEGFVRRSNKEFIQFLFISLSSAAELQSHMYVALDQAYIAQQTFESIYEQAGKASKMISGLITYLRNNEKTHKLEKQKKADKLKKLDKQEKL